MQRRLARRRRPGGCGGPGGGLLRDPRLLQRPGGGRLGGADACRLGLLRLPDAPRQQPDGLGAEVVPAAAAAQRALLVALAALRAEGHDEGVGLHALAARAHELGVELLEPEELPEDDEGVDAARPDGGADAAHQQPELAVALRQPLVVGVDDLLEAAVAAHQQLADRHVLAQRGLLAQEVDGVPLAALERDVRHRGAALQRELDPGGEGLDLAHELLRHADRLRADEGGDGEHRLRLLDVELQRRLAGHQPHVRHAAPRRLRAAGSPPPSTRLSTVAGGLLRAVVQPAVGALQHGDVAHRRDRRGGREPELRRGGVDPGELGVEPLQHPLEHAVVLAVEAVDLVERAAPGVLQVQLHVAGLGARREPEPGDQRQLLHGDARRELRPAASLDEGGRLARDLEARVAQGARQVGAHPAGRRPHGALGVEDDAAAHGALDVGAGVVRRRVHGRRVDGRRVIAVVSIAADAS